MDQARRARLEELAARLGHRFRDLELLERALTHASHAHEQPAATGRHNEALEFLGDAVLGFVVADLLHRRDPEGAEGGKSKARAALVSAESLARRASALALPQLIRLGRGEEKSGGRTKEALLANAYEALLAALYLDGGLAAARAFVERDLGEALEQAGAAPPGDFKSALQEQLQARGEPVPEYVVVDEVGPAHRRRFVVECRIAGRSPARGEGYSKKEAQQQAARSALEAAERTRLRPPAVPRSRPPRDTPRRRRRRPPGRA